jgi:hypothetical protein
VIGHSEPSIEDCEWLSYVTYVPLSKRSVWGGGGGKGGVVLATIGYSRHVPMFIRFTGTLQT